MYNDIRRRKGPKGHLEMDAVMLTKARGSSTNSKRKKKHSLHIKLINAVDVDGIYIYIYKPNYALLLSI